MNIRYLFAWYDVWIGAYWDRKARRLYLLPLPCIGLVIEFRTIERVVTPLPGRPQIKVSPPSNPISRPHTK